MIILHSVGQRGPAENHQLFYRSVSQRMRSSGFFHRTPSVSVKYTGVCGSGMWWVPKGKSVIRKQISQHDSTRCLVVCHFCPLNVDVIFRARSLYVYIPHWPLWSFIADTDILHWEDRLCGLVVRVSGYKYRGLGFDSRRYQIFWVVVGLERGPLSLVRSIEEVLE